MAAGASRVSADVSAEIFHYIEETGRSNQVDLIGQPV